MRLTIQVQRHEKWNIILKKISPTDTVESSKHKIFYETCIPWSDQILKYGDRELDDDKTLAYYGIFTYTILTLIIDVTQSTIPSKRKLESSSADETSKALKSSASKSVKSTGASESQQSSVPIKSSQSSGAVAGLDDSRRQPKTLVSKLNMNSKTQPGTTSNHNAPSIASELKDTSVRATAETRHLDAEPVISSSPTMPSPSGSIQQDHNSGNTTMNLTSSSSFWGIPTQPGAIIEEKITAQVNASRFLGAAQNSHMQALENQRQALTTVKEHAIRLQTASRALDDAKKMADESSHALKVAEQALGDAWKKMNESMS